MGKWPRELKIWFIVPQRGPLIAFFFDWMLNIDFSIILFVRPQRGKDPSGGSVDAKEAGLSTAALYTTARKCNRNRYIDRLVG